MEEEIYKKLYEINDEIKFFKYYKVLFKDEHHVLLQEVYSYKETPDAKHLIKSENLKNYMRVKNK